MTIETRVIKGKRQYAIFAQGQRQSCWYDSWSKVNDILKLLTTDQPQPL